MPIGQMLAGPGRRVRLRAAGGPGPTCRSGSQLPQSPRHEASERTGVACSSTVTVTECVFSLSLSPFGSDCRRASMCGCANVNIQPRLLALTVPFELSQRYLCVPCSTSDLLREKAGREQHRGPGRGWGGSFPNENSS